MSRETDRQQLPAPAAGVVSAHAAVVTCVVLVSGAVAGGVLAFARSVLARRQARTAAGPGQPAELPGKPWPAGRRGATGVAGGASHAGHP